LIAGQTSNHSEAEDKSKSRLSKPDGSLGIGSLKKEAAHE
jgi:hypothetical protein